MEQLGQSNEIVKTKEVNLKEKEESYREREKWRENPKVECGMDIIR